MSKDYATEFQRLITVIGWMFVSSTQNLNVKNWSKVFGSGNLGKCLDHEALINGWSPYKRDPKETLPPCDGSL